MLQSVQQYLSKHAKLLIAALFILCYPVGVYKICKQKYALWIKGLYIIMGVPVFLILYSFLIIVLLGAVLPDLDQSVNPNLPRTIWNEEGHYSCTILKSRHETGNAYEQFELHLEPRGSNWWHYHAGFEEAFTVIKGELVVETKDEKHLLKEGESFTVPKRAIHEFYNPTDSMVTFRVRTSPASGLEKSLRISYGLIAEGKLSRNGATAPMSHLFLMGCYSDSYPPPDLLPTWVQEPLFNGIAKIAQWRGDDKALEVYFK